MKPHNMATFKGGVALAGKKELTRDAGIAPIAPPARVVIPLSQHTGAPATPCVSVGDHVRIGQRIGASVGFVSAQVHASVAGMVIDIADMPIIGNRMSQCIVIDNDGTSEWALLPMRSAWQTDDPGALLSQIDDAGIVGMGGAAFPSRVKLAPPPGKPVDTLVLNGAECEPYLTADYRLMIERSAEIVVGAQILQKVLNVSRCIIGIEEHGTEAIIAIEAAIFAAHACMTVLPLQVKYPQGAEKMLIKSATGRTVPSGGLPADAGVVVHNVGTAYAVYDAIILGRPLVQRVITVSGELIAHPSNLLVPVGTPVRDLIAHCGGLTAPVSTFVCGGPMMGSALGSLDMPVVKGTSGILALRPKRPIAPEHCACINCGRCFSACSMRLKPLYLANLADEGDVDEAIKASVLDCCSCGVCSAVCPGHRPNSEKIKQLRTAALAKKSTK